MKTLLAIAVCLFFCLSARAADEYGHPEHFGACIPMADGTTHRHCQAVTVIDILKVINENNGGAWRFVLVDREPPAGGYQKSGGTLGNIADPHEMEVFLLCVLEMGLASRSEAEHVTYIRTRSAQEPEYWGCEQETVHLTGDTHE